MDAVKTLTAALSASDSVRLLADALNAYVQSRELSRDEMGEATIPPLWEAVDLTSLPTWGPSPESLRDGFFSWDPQEVLWAGGNPPGLYQDHEGSWSARGGPWSCEEREDV